MSLCLRHRDIWVTLDAWVCSLYNGSFKRMGPLTPRSSPLPKTSHSDIRVMTLLEPGSAFLDTLHFNGLHLQRTIATFHHDQTCHLLTLSPIWTLNLKLPLSASNLDLQLPKHPLPAGFIPPGFCLLYGFSSLSVSSFPGPWTPQFTASPLFLIFDVFPALIFSHVMPHSHYSRSICLSFPQLPTFEQ